MSMGLRVIKIDIPKQPHHSVIFLTEMSLRMRTIIGYCKNKFEMIKYRRISSISDVAK